MAYTLVPVPHGGDNETPDPGVPESSQAYTLVPIPHAGGGEELAGFKLDDLADVNAPNPGDNDHIYWDETAGEWVNGPVPYPVTSVHARVGDVVALQPDYAAFYADINHNHAGVYSPVGHGHTVFGLSSDGFVPGPASTPGTTFLRDDGTWAIPPGGGGGAVDSVFGRTGAVVALQADYAAFYADISHVGATGAAHGTFALNIDGFVPGPAAVPGTTFLRDDGTWAIPPGGGTGAVDSVFGRTGDVVALQPDYAAFYADINHNHDGDYAPLSHVGAGGFEHPDATGAVSGFLSGADKTKLDGITVGAEPNLVDSVFARTGDVVATASDYDAIQIDNTPAGNITATEVQGALNELDTIKMDTAIYDPAGDGLVDYAAATVVPVRKGSAGTIPKGAPVYVSGWNTGQGLLEVEAADAASFATMPALGLAADDVTQGNTDYVLRAGDLQGVDTSAWAVDTLLYVAAGGGLTDTPPVVAGEVPQIVAIVRRSHASNGDVSVFPGAFVFAGQDTMGYVPNPGTETGAYLRDDGTWAIPPGGGGGLVARRAQDISPGFDGVKVQFNLIEETTLNPLSPASAMELRVALGYVPLAPEVDYTVTGSDIVFTLAPYATDECHITYNDTS